MSKRKVISALAVLLVLAVVICGCAVYLSDYYRADSSAIEKFADAYSVNVEGIGGGITVYGDTSADCGIIFYPGGKVESAAYEPLMIALAARGVLCVLVEMPFNLAVLDVNAADGIREMFLDTERWYMGGHSLGGSMAASYLDKNSGDFVGLVLLGSYSTADLVGDGVRVLSIYGSEDGVMNREKYEQYKSNLPSDYTEIVISGGSHAYFGMYGEQDGDGVADITPDQQIYMTAKHIAEFIEG